MSRFRTCVAAVLATAVLGGAWLVGGRPPVPAAQPAAAATAAEPTPSPAAPSPAASTPPDTSTTPAPPAAVGPPKGTSATARSYLDRYDAHRVDWDAIVKHGHPIPRANAQCRASWKKSGRDSRLAWRRGQFWCLDGLVGGHWKPQGIAGSGTTEGYLIGGRAAGRRNLVLTSWYSRAPEKGLFAPNRAGQSVTRLMVLDLDRHRYARVELVRPQGASRLRNLNSHGSGLAWAGQYLYSSSRSWLWMYNADDLLEIHGHYVLPAVARWSVSGSGGASSISIDRSLGRDKLLAVNYTKTGSTYVNAFDLDRHGRLATPKRHATPSLALATGFGEKHRVVRSVAALAVPGTHYQGVGRWGHYTFVNSSSLRLEPGGPGRDAMVVMHNGTVHHRIRLPEGNVESVYVNPRRRTYASLTEGGSRFLFVLPLRQVVARPGH